jgi:hypothetical protein
MEEDKKMSAEVIHKDYFNLVLPLFEEVSFVLPNKASGKVAVSHKSA